MLPIGRHRQKQAVRVLSCRQFVEVVTDFLESSLDDHVRRDTLHHLNTCPQCRLYLNQIQTVTRLLRRLPQQNLTRQPD